MVENINEGRLADMDAHGIDVQVLSNVSTQLLPATLAPELVRDVNDRLAAACRRHPDHFSAFASLPTSAPADAPDELRRAAEELGFVGAMIHGRTNDEFLSAAAFDPILKGGVEAQRSRRALSKRVRCSRRPLASAVPARFPGRH